MKKFISMIIVATMLLSLCVVSVSAATVANPTINVHAEPYDGTNPPSYYNGTGYDVYKITYTTTGIDTGVDKMLMMSIKLTISDNTKVAAKTWKDKRTSGSTSSRDTNGVKSYLVIQGEETITVKPYTISEGFYNWQNLTAGIDAFDWDTYSDFSASVESKPYIETLVYVTEGESVTFTYETDLVGGTDAQSEIVLVNWDDEDDPAARRYYNDELRYTINGVAGNVLTLGESGSGGSGGSETEEPGIAADDDEVGKQAISASLTDFNGAPVTLENNYGIAKFSQTLNTAVKEYYLYAKAVGGETNIKVNSEGAFETPEDRAAASKYKINFAIEEIDADVSFYAIVRSKTRTIDTMTLIAVDK